MKLKRKSLMIIPLFLFMLTISTSGINKKNAIWYNNKGWELLKQENYSRAVYNFRNALTNNSMYFDAILGLGLAYNKLGAYEQSVELFSRALRIKPESSESCEGMGFALLGLGRYKASLKYFDKATKLSDENLNAHFGIAFLYEAMGNRIWSKRKLRSLLRINPFHVPSLLLLADIKSKEGRLSEAKKLVEKAIEIDKKTSIGFVKYGQILLREFLNTENDDYLDDARNAFQNALSLKPSSKEANKYMGYISLEKKEYDKAINYFKTIQKHHRSSEITYSMAISYDMTDDYNMALKNFLKSYQSRPSDSVLRSRIEDFLIFRNYKMGHPARIMLNKELMELAKKRSNRNLSYETMVYLRRALLLNPMNSKARELLLNYYSVMGYSRFYIDEVKELLKMFPGKKYRDILSVEISKRRNHLYHKEGYSDEMPLRSVPGVLVLNFYSDDITFHPDAGEMIGSYLTFVLKQFGRMEVVGIKRRREIVTGLKTAPDHIESSINKLHDMVKYGKIPHFDYIIYGKYNEHGSKISVSCKLVDFKKGFIISDFNLSMGGKESLPGLSLRIAKKIYNTIPFSGKILKLKSKGIVVNLGLFDDISKGDKFIIKRFNDSIINGKLFNKSIVFKVKDVNTLISYAEPENVSDLEGVDYEDTVYPYKQLVKSKK